MRGAGGASPRLPSLSQPTPIAVLVSGSGSNLQALLDRQGTEYEVVLVLSDRPDVLALDRARQAGVTTAVVAWAGDRSAFTTAVCDEVERSGAVYVVLAGFMRILGPEAIHRFERRIVNVHPSLLPAFPGAHAVAQALAAGVGETGVTVHFVDEEVDHGPIIAQVPVEIREGDDEASLHARIQEQEHLLYPEVVAALATGALDRDGGSLAWSPA